MKPRYARTWRLVVGGIALAAVLFFIAWLLPQISEVVILLLFAIFLAAATRPYAVKISHLRVPLLGAGLPIEIAVLLIYLGIAVALTLLGLFIVPQLIGEVRDLVRTFPQLAAEVTAFLERLEDFPVGPCPK